MSAITEWRRNSSRPLDVREVHLGDGRLDDLERVTQRVAVVRPGAGVDDHRPGALDGDAVELLHHLALEVGLERQDGEAAALGVPGDLALELAQRERAVVRRVAASEHVQIDAVQQAQGRHSALSHVTTSSSRPAGTCTRRRGRPKRLQQDELDAVGAGLLVARR